MRKSPCCSAHYVRYGARRRRCTICLKTFRIRKSKRGRKRVRSRTTIVSLVLDAHASLRGLATMRGSNREMLRRVFKQEANRVLKNSEHVLVPTGPLIAIVDGIWLSKRRQVCTSCCYVIVVRAVHGTEGVVVLMHVKEGTERWSGIFELLPESIRNRIVALVSDDGRNLRAEARKYGWYHQLCIAHLKRKLSELRGFRNLPDRAIRQQIVSACFAFLDATASTHAHVAYKELKRLLTSSTCPRQVRVRLTSLVTNPERYETFRRVPDLNLPITTNSVECINSLIRSVWSKMRGVHSFAAKRWWIELIQTHIQGVSVCGWKQVLQHKEKEKIVDSEEQYQPN